MDPTSVQPSMIPRRAYGHQEESSSSTEKVKVKRKPTLQESMGVAAPPASGGTAMTPRKRNMSEKIEQLEAVTKALQAERTMVQARLEAANAQLASSLSARDTADVKAEGMLEQLAATQAALKAMEAKWADDIHTVKHQMWEMKKVGTAAASVSHPGALSARTELSEGASLLSARSAKSVAQQEAMMEVMHGEVVILKKEMERVQKQVSKEGPAKLGVGMPAEELDESQSAALAARVATVEATVAQIHDHISRCAAAVEVLNDEMTRTKQWRTMVDERLAKDSRNVVGALAQLRHPRVVASTLVAAWRGALRTLSVTRGLVLSWTSDQTDVDEAGSDDGAESAKVTEREDEGWKLWISTVGTGVGLGLLLALAQRPGKATSKSDTQPTADRNPRVLKAPALRVPTMYQ